MKSAVLAAAGLFALTVGASARAADAPIGSVRISDRNVRPANYASGVVNAASEVAASNAPQAQAEGGAPNGPVIYLSGNAAVDWWRVRQYERQLARECAAEGCETSSYHGHLFKKSHGHGHCHGDGCDGCNGNYKEHCVGCCGHCCLSHLDDAYGCRFLDTTCYNMSYPLDPWYFDRRDGAVYAAQGWGAPMAIPTAPNVTHQYNYGWGIPSSRITPMSRMAPHPGAIEGAVAPR